jgi:hypothetical protein
MEIRFGKFPDDHHFIRITRPFVEQSFKLFGWLVAIATLRFGHLKTGSSTLLYVEWFLELLMLAYVGAFVDWILRFRRNEKANSNVPAVKSRWRWSVIVFATLILVGTGNFLVEQVITAVLEFQKVAK